MVTLNKGTRLKAPRCCDSAFDFNNYRPPGGERAIRTTPQMDMRTLWKKTSSTAMRAPISRGVTLVATVIMAH